MRLPANRSILAAVAVMALAGCAGFAPDAPTPPRPTVGYGKPISEADITPWNIDIRTSDGRGLPRGRGTAAEGKKIYDAKCLACHGADAKGGSVYGTMVGGIGSFTTNTRVLTPGSMYPYALILFDYIRRAMPMDKPQTLTPDEVYALSAYLLNLNELIQADGVIDQNTLPKIQMPNRNGFIRDDRPDVKAARCLTNCNE